MTRLRVIADDERPLDANRSTRSRTRPWRRLASRYWRWQASVAENPRFEPLRARPVRRLLVVAFILAVAICLAVFWTQGLWSEWLHYLTGAVVVALDALIVLAARGVTALPERQLDERQLRVHRRLLTRAYWAIMLVLLVITLVLPQLIDEGVIRPLDGGQVFALLWGLALLGGMTGICLEAWEAPVSEEIEREPQ